MCFQISFFFLKNAVVVWMFDLSVEVLLVGIIFVLGQW